MNLILYKRKEKRKEGEKGKEYNLYTYSIIE